MTDDRYHQQLCDTLMTIFGDGTHELPAGAEALGRAGVAAPGGAGWTGDALAAELHRLASPPDKTLRPALVPFEDGGQPCDGEPLAPALPRDLAGDERVEYLVRHGLRNQWNCVAASSEVTDRPVAMKRLGEKLVLWRDADGKVQALEDRCPHRGAALSIGEVRDGVIACAYHGVRVDGGGRVVEVPAMPSCPLKGQTLVRRYPAVEHYQAIWAYFGEDAHAAPPPLELPDELVSPEWSGVLHVDTWDNHYQYIYDNLCDPMHGPYLHGRSYTQQYGPKNDEIKIARNERGFEVFREGQRGVNFDWMEIVDTGSGYYTRVEIPLPPTAGPGGHMGIIFYVTPVDDSHTRISAWRLRKVSGWQRDLWSFLFKWRIRSLVDAVLEQDKTAMTALPPWPAPENLYQHDIGVAAMRRRIRDAAKAQVYGRARAAAPAEAEAHT